MTRFILASVLFTILIHSSAFSSKTIEDIPNPVLGIVFSHLERLEDMKQVSLVSKRFNEQVKKQTHKGKVIWTAPDLTEDVVYSFLFPVLTISLINIKPQMIRSKLDELSRKLPFARNMILPFQYTGSDKKGYRAHPTPKGKYLGISGASQAELYTRVQLFLALATSMIPAQVSALVASMGNVEDDEHLWHKLQMAQDMNGPSSNNAVLLNTIQLAIKTPFDHFTYLQKAVSFLSSESLSANNRFRLAAGLARHPIDHLKRANDIPSGLFRASTSIETRLGLFEKIAAIEDPSDRKNFMHKMRKNSAGKILSPRNMNSFLAMNSIIEHVN